MVNAVLCLNLKVVCDWGDGIVGNDMLGCSAFVRISGLRSELASRVGEGEDGEKVGGILDAKQCTVIILKSPEPHYSAARVFCAWPFSTDFSRTIENLK